MITGQIKKLLSSIQTKYGTTTSTNFAYVNDALGRRTSIIQTGTVFGNYTGGGLVTALGYNERSEVNSSQTTFLGTTTAVAGRSHGFSYDPIGNRVTSSIEGVTSTYTTNVLNQYTDRTVPARMTVTGFAGATVAVKVNELSATRQGEYFSKVFSVTNTYAALYLVLIMFECFLIVLITMESVPLGVAVVGLFILGRIMNPFFLPKMFPKLRGIDRGGANK